MNETIDNIIKKYKERGIDYHYLTELKEKSHLLLKADAMLPQRYMVPMIAHQYGHCVDTETMIWLRPGMAEHLFIHIMQLAQRL